MSIYNVAMYIKRRLGLYVKPFSAKSQHAFTTTTSDTSKHRQFGIMFDIDGVLVRGRRVISSAIEAIRNVAELKIPIIFLSNSGCETEEHKARVLTTQLHHKIQEEQVVLSHSPLRCMDILHDKHVVISGQGPTAEIAMQCGFKHISTIEQFSEAYPLLDMNDRRKRFHMPQKQKIVFPTVEGLLLLGEPIGWEMHLQILIDLLITNGNANQQLSAIPKENLPIIAVNTDLLWMGEAANPRFGNGAFLCCLESLYKKLTGSELVYSSILGKPNLLAYIYAVNCLEDQAAAINGKEVDLERVYMIGDNIDTDIYGTNIYQKYLSSYKRSQMEYKEEKYCQSFQSRLNSVIEIESVLVQTGVSAIERSFPQRGINHLHRDTIYEPEMTMPSYTVSNVLDAVNLIFRKEKISLS